MHQDPCHVTKADAKEQSIIPPFSHFSITKFPPTYSLVLQTIIGSTLPEQETRVNYLVKVKGGLGPTAPHRTIPGTAAFVTNEARVPDMDVFRIRLCCHASIRRCVRGPIFERFLVLRRPHRASRIAW